MGRLLSAGVFAVLLTVFLISSFTHGAINRLGDLSRAGRLAVFATACAVGTIFYLYIDGTVDHLIWLWDVPARPDQEIAFVSVVESAIHQWRTATAGERHCAQLSTDLADRSGEVADWTGIVTSKYRIGTSLALIVQVGRYTILRTSYMQSHDAILIDKDSPLFSPSDSLVTGDPVVFSGSLVRDSCVLSRADYPDVSRAEFVFRFSSIRHE
jgi:hypothetical protein